MSYTPLTQLAESAPLNRKLSYNNKVFNGSFELAPSFTAETNANGFIDGTAGGSSSNYAYGWWAQPVAAASSMRFDPTFSHSGTNSLRITSASAGTFVAGICDFNQGTGAVSGSPAVNLIIPVVGGRTYTLSGYGYLDAGTNIKLRMYSYTGTPAAWTFQSSTFTGNTVTVTTTGSWQSMSSTFVAPAGATGMVVFVSFTASASGQHAWFDDIVLSTS
jgi:hypothetical protein